MAIQLASAYGAEVYTTAGAPGLPLFPMYPLHKILCATGSDEKSRRCEEIGAKACFNYKTQVGRNSLHR